MPKPEYRAAVLTISDRAAGGRYEDESGPLLAARLEAIGFRLAGTEIIPDDKAKIAVALRHFADVVGVDLIVTTGGTGLGPRDVTPEATARVADRLVPGIAEAIRQHSLVITKRAMLSRGLAAIRKSTLIVNLPGSPKAASESLDAFESELTHALAMLAGQGHG